MSDTATPLIEPTDTDLPPCAEGEEWARPMLQRGLEVLGELAELGLRMSRAIARQATGEASDPEPAFQGDLPLAFSRVSRAVRMAVLLQAKLIQDIKTGGRKTASDEDEDESPIEWKVQWVDEITGKPVRSAAEEREERAAERRESERCERLERDDIYAAVMGSPREQVIERIRVVLSPAAPHHIFGVVGGWGGDGSAALGRTGHPHPQPFPPRGGRGNEAGLAPVSPSPATDSS
jgi:hypothetical protein